MVSGAALNSNRNQLTGSRFCFFLGALIDFSKFNSCIVLCFLLDGGDQIVLRLFTGQAGNALKRSNLLIFELVTRFLGLLNLCELAIELFILLIQSICFTVECFFLLGQTALELLRFVAAFLDLTLSLGTASVNLVFRLKNRFTFFGFASLDCIVDNAGGFLFGTADFLFGYLFAIQAANDHTNNQSDNTDDQSDYGINHDFCETPPGFLTFRNLQSNNNPP